RVEPIGYRITQGEWTTTKGQASTVWGQVYGDLGKNIAGLGTDKLIQVAIPDTKDAMNKMKSVADADNHTSFKSRLENAMLASAQVTTDAIMSVGMAIHENNDYGSDCLKKLKRVNARARDRNVGEKELQSLAQKMIREDINAMRQKWADEWLYYGNDAGSTMGVSKSIELEMWGLWILNENLKIK